MKQHYVQYPVELYKKYYFKTYQRLTSGAQAATFLLFIIQIKQ
jgi:hypothetical protein